MFGRKAQLISNLKVDLESAKRQRDVWYDDLGVVNAKLYEANRKLVAEIEARIAAEDAVHLITHIACALADKKRPKKKG